MEEAEWVMSAACLMLENGGVERWRGGGVEGWRGWRGIGGAGLAGDGWGCGGGGGGVEVGRSIPPPLPAPQLHRSTGTALKRKKSAWGCFNFDNRDIYDKIKKVISLAAIPCRMHQISFDL